MEVNTQFEREARAVLWVQWVFFNTLGWTIGRLFIGGFEFSAPTRYAVIGLCLGALQWFVLRHYAGMRRVKWLAIWLLSTAVGLGLGRWMAGIALGLVPIQLQIQAQSAVIPRVLISGLFGLMLGVGLGLFQSVIIGRKINKPQLWLLVNVIGWTVAFQIDALFNSNSILGSIIKATVASMVTGIGVIQNLRPEHQTIIDH